VEKSRVLENWLPKFFEHCVEIVLFCRLDHNADLFKMKLEANWMRSCSVSQFLANGETVVLCGCNAEEPLDLTGDGRAALGG